jgi:hypothetical protein
VSITKRSLGKCIAALRWGRELYQEILVDKAGYSTKFISLVERWINAPSVDGLDRIVSALGVEIKGLLDFRGRMK